MTRAVLAHRLLKASTSVFTCHNFEQVRFAGHAKWQNIAGTKAANDLNKGKLCSRYVMLVRKAIMSNNRQTDPKLNGKLAQVLTEAAKLNIPKATLERAIERTKNLKILNVNLEIEGPSKSSIIARCETENVPQLRRDIKKAIKKYEGGLLPDNSIINMFQSQGFIRCSKKTLDNRDLTEEYAEEAAIMAGAEEIRLETNPDASDENLKEIYVFLTDAQTMNQCKGELEKYNFQVISADLELVPYNAIDFGEDIYDEVERLAGALRELDQVTEVYHNVKPPEQNA